MAYPHPQTYPKPTGTGLFGTAPKLPTQPAYRAPTSWDYNQGNPFPNMTTASMQGPVTTMTPGTSQGPAMVAAPKNIQPTMQVSYPEQPAMVADFSKSTPGVQSSYAAPTQYTPPPQAQTPPLTGPAPGAFETQYATMDNLQPYMNPYLDQIIGRGNRAIESSAAARGLLGSSATINDIGDWTAQATANEYQNAANRFGLDRGYMTDQYWKNTLNNQDQYWKTNAWNYGMFTDERNDWQNRMNGWQQGMGGLVNTGYGATNNMVDFYSNLGNAMAMLYGNRGDVGAAQAMGQGNNNSGLLAGFMNLLPFFG